MQTNSTRFDVHPSTSEAKLRRVLGGMSIFTLLMTIPQVLTIWVGSSSSRCLYIHVERLSAFRSPLVLVRSTKKKTRIYICHVSAG